MKTMLTDSELILNPDGSIYHLNLRPENIGDIVLMGGDPNRVPVISSRLDAIEFKTSKREFVTHTGRLGDKRITVISTGIGTDNIDIVLNELDALVNIDLETRQIKEKKKNLTIIRLGTSGGLQPDIQEDDIVVSSHGLGLDNLMHYYARGNKNEETEMTQSFLKQMGISNENIRPYIAAGSSKYFPIFKKHFKHGITVTCSGFYGPQGRKLRLQPALPELVNKLHTFDFNGNRITNFEMETSGIYGLGQLLGHHCISLNTIIANRVTGRFSQDPYKAIENMIDKAMEIIAEL
jgi:uridine phosphorylase